METGSAAGGKLIIPGSIGMTYIGIFPAGETTITNGCSLSLYRHFPFVSQQPPLHVAHRDRESEVNVVGMTCII